MRYFTDPDTLQHASPEWILALTALHDSFGARLANLAERLAGCFELGTPRAERPGRRSG